MHTQAGKVHSHREVHVTVGPHGASMGHPSGPMGPRSEKMGVRINVLAGFRGTLSTDAARGTD